METGLHISPADIVNLDENVDMVQMFISNPRSYTAAQLTQTLKRNVAILKDKNIKLYIHAPYLINVVSAKEEVRQKSVTSLKQQLQIADEVGAAGVIVHAGQGGKDTTVENATKYWYDAVTYQHETPLLIENTAGGNAAPGRNLKNLAGLIKQLKATNENIGVCIDTCHSHAAGQTIQDLKTLHETIGTIDLFHVNDSKDAFDSGRDRHQNIGEGNLNIEELTAVLQTWKNTPAIVETPGPIVNQLKDVNWIRNTQNQLNKSSEIAVYCCPPYDKSGDFTALF